MQNRSLKDHFVIMLKGMAMGAADVVPGVSGGTIAFISGIYEELIDTINSINLDALKLLRKEGIKAVWKHINGNFLVALVLGIGISIASLAKLITYFLHEHPVLIWSFFFGLIVASVVFMANQLKQKNLASIVSILIGTVIAYFVTVLPPMSSNADYWFIFLSGSIAICAMILPGISGSFILLILGAYEIVLGAVKDLKIGIIAVFAAGAGIGLLSFARLLKWMFAKYHDITVAFLCGFLIGSLNKVWPWKQALETVVIKEKVKVLTEKNLLPSDYADATASDPQVVYAILLAIFGFALIMGLEKLGSHKSNKV